MRVKEDERASKFIGSKLFTRWKQMDRASSVSAQRWKNGEGKR